ncbi:MAG: tetratricopeptide repeat protein [Burkholderiales bacterium]
MKPYSRLAVATLVAVTLTACAQTMSVGDPSADALVANAAPVAPAAPTADLSQAIATEKASASADSGLDAQLFYQLLVGELEARGGEPGAGFSRVFEAARQTGDARLYQHAADIALQARSGESALRAAQAWKDAYPDSRDANRYVLQILVVLQRLADTVEPLMAAVRLAPAAERPQVLLAVPRAYARAEDKQLAARVVEEALAPWAKDPEIGADSWVAIGRVRLAANYPSGALEAAQRAQALDEQSEGAALLALELMADQPQQAEPLVKRQLATKQTDPAVRMGYARALIEKQRWLDAAAQLDAVTSQQPTFAQGWLLRGALEAQQEQLDAAQTSLKRFLELTGADAPGDQQFASNQAQAYLTLSQIAEKRKDYAGAQAWLDKIPDVDQLMAAQLRRASILAADGKMEQARQLLRGLPERTAGDARMKLLAEVQLLRDNKQYAQAYDVLAAEIARAKGDDATELLYDQAMLAEKLGRIDEMERLLRQLIAAKPGFYHAYNALGYSLADRNLRLDEARDLVQKALSLAPGDPFITDSLGWVEFRAGNWDKAAEILGGAYKTKPDAEIGAHYGEVLWNMNRKDEAREIWKQGLRTNPDSDVLRDTLKRLQVGL